MHNIHNNEVLIKLNKLQNYCMEHGMSSAEAFNFAVKCKDLNILDDLNIILPNEVDCENCLYNSKCDAPTITDNRINASNCGSFVNINDVLIKADVLSKLCNSTWYSCDEKGILHEGAHNNGEAYYKYSDILRILGVEQETESDG